MSIYQHQFVDISGTHIPLSNYQGRVLLLFNSASECGFTPQLAQLQQLHERYADQGLSIIGFPCNQFKAQEPGSAETIAAFCQQHYGVTFTLSEKIDVNGAHAHPLWQELKRLQPGVLGTGRIKWNFTKFLVGKDGSVLKRFAPMTNPSQLQADIEQALRA